MRIIKILSFIVLFLIVLEGYSYINTLVSEKYEVSQMETIYKVKGKNLPDNKIELRKNEIEKQKEKTKIQIIVLCLILIILLSILIYNKIGSNK